MIGLALLTLVVAGSASNDYRADFPLPSASVPQGWGVNIHFTDAAPGEMEKIAKAGFKWVRMDFGWAGVERKRGVYQFAPYERLMASLRAVGMRPIIILDYGNDLYGKGAPRSAEAVTAFCRFVAAAMRRFAGQGIVWEMWNEPNISFWPPKPNVGEYIRLATEVGKTIRQIAPKEWYVGPGVSTIDWNFLEECFRGGLLKYWDAVTVHPYRGSNPESVIEDWRRLRRLVDRYAGGHSVGLISSEWGYASQEGGAGLEQQADYATRQYLANLTGGANLSIWYDWKNDGLNPKDPECNFGTVDTTLTAKPAYSQIERLSRDLNGYRYRMRLTQGSPDDYVFAFERHGVYKYVVWTTAAVPHEVRLNLGPDSRSITLTGRPTALPSIDSSWFGAWNPISPEILLGDAATVKGRLKNLLGPIVSSSRTRKLKVSVDLNDGGDGSSQVFTLAPSKNPNSIDALSRQITGDWLAHPRSLVWTLADGSGRSMSQQTDCIQTDAVSFYPLIADGRIFLSIADPLHRKGTGWIQTPVAFETLQPASSGQVNGSIVLESKSPTKSESYRETRIGYGPSNAIPRRSEATPLSLLSIGKFASRGSTTIDPSRYGLLQDGDAKIAGAVTASMSSTTSCPIRASEAVKIDYQFSFGWKFLFLQARGEVSERRYASPVSLNMLIMGDRSNDSLRMRFVDSLGQTFQPDGGKIDWDGWKAVSFPLDGRDAGHWGGPDDGVVHYPIRLDALALIDSTGGAGSRHSVEITAITLVERQKP
ncbi:MAG: cellulase family glycosylhydrolase [Fimbriimonas sp.]|nr:cellulase family glycosylhydrolase [Fimbriimonas sp.]